MSTELKTRLEETFFSLPEDQRAGIISLGVAMKLSHLRNRLALAMSKVKAYEEQYGRSLAELESKGLPNDADYVMHEDYILWHHWSEAADQARQEVGALENVAAEGLYLEPASRPRPITSM